LGAVHGARSVFLAVLADRATDFVADLADEPGTGLVDRRLDRSLRIEQTGVALILDVVRERAVVRDEHVDGVDVDPPRLIEDLGAVRALQTSRLGPLSVALDLLRRSEPLVNRSRRHAPRRRGRAGRDRTRRRGDAENEPVQTDLHEGPPPWVGHV